MTASNTLDTANAITVRGYGASGALIGGHTLQEMDISRTPPQPDEVLIEVLYCGVCHSDIHQVANDWSNTIYPCVPGHEIIGRIAAVGSAVTNFQQGQVVGVGCMIDSCKTCKSCLSGNEQFCLGPVGMTMTYNGYWKPDGSGYNTFGGFSTHIVANEAFVLRIPEGLDIKAAAPILCAGVTTYSPLKHRGIKPGDKVGIIGIGGLGHMGVMLAKAMGANVVAITSHAEKRDAALALGADDVLIWSNEDDLERHAGSFDFLLCTIPYTFDLNTFIPLMGPRGSMITVGLLGPYDKPTNNMELAKFSTTVGASLIGSVAETQEVLDFCAEHQILPHVEMIDIQDINDAFDKIKDEDVRFRYVIDMASLKR